MRLFPAFRVSRNRQLPVIPGGGTAFGRRFPSHSRR